MHRFSPDYRGDLPYFSFPGGYPLYYVDDLNRALCPHCASRAEHQYILDVLSDLANWCIDPSDGGTYIDQRDRPVYVDINYENSNLYCDNCDQRIESVYVNDEPDETEELPQ